MSHEKAILRSCRIPFAKHSFRRLQTFVVVMVLVEAIFDSASHLAVRQRQLRRGLSAFLHPGNAGSLFFSRSPPKNLEGIMSAAEMVLMNVTVP
jgi:hypothetical protein